MNDPQRKFEAKPAVRGLEPLQLGMVGPPGGGKTYSALRLAVGIQEVYGGDIIVIDTEAGRARKYASNFKFLHVDLDPPHRSDAFLSAIEQQLPRNPACIIVDSMSDEHEGIGGYLEYHDEMIPKMGGNEWAAWSKPKAARKRLVSGLLHIKTPIIFTFRAAERTEQKKDLKGKTVITNIGWQPVAPLAIVHALDMTCILPPRADGVPVWKSDKFRENFIIKLPEQFKALFSGETKQLDERLGRQLAQWSKGDQPTAAVSPSLEPPAADHGAAPLVTAPSDSAPRPKGGLHLPADDGALSRDGWTDVECQMDDALADAATRGTDALKAEWKVTHPVYQKKLQARLRSVHQPAAQQHDDVPLAKAASRSSA